MGKIEDSLSVKLENQGIFDKNLMLYLIDLPNKEMIDKLPFTAGINEVFVFARGDSDENKVGSCYNTLFAKSESNEHIECKVELVYVSVNATYEINYLPRGYSGICLLKFDSKVPDILFDKLSQYDVKHDPKKHDILILSQRKVLNSI